MVLARPETAVPRQLPAPQPSHAHIRGRRVDLGRARLVASAGLSLVASARLTILCVGLVVAETLALLTVHAGSTLALAPEVAAPVPWGIFHDERWLLVHAGSWPAVVAGGIGMVAARGLLTGVMVKFAWPASAQPLSWHRALLRGCASTAVAALLLSPCASLLVAFELAPISDLWLAAIPTALGIALFVHHGPVDSWWRRHPRLRSMGWVVVSYAELTIAGAAMLLAPQAWTPLIGIVAGVADAWIWRRMVHALARPTRLRWAPVSPVGLVGVVGATVVAVTAASAPTSAASIPPRSSAAGAAQLTHPHSATGTATPPAKPAKPRPVLLVSGYGVRWDGNAPSLGPGIHTREFSYRGTTRDGRPLPYSSRATQESLPVLLARFREQVNTFARQSGGHIDIVGESEGSLLASIYLQTTANPPVDNVVLLSPLVRPSRASYPGPQHTGPGIGAAWVLRGIAHATNTLTPMHVSPDSAFIQSLGAHPDALRDLFCCPAPGVRQFAILPMADAVGVPPSALSAMPHEAVAALHGTLLIDPGVRSDIAKYLLSSTTPRSGNNGLEKLAAAASAAWQAPPRQLAADPPATTGCQHSTQALRAWLGGSARS
jgi:hypothetical protein